MSKTSTSTLHQYARVGAAAHIKELEAQIAEIRRAFPDLGRDAAPKRRGRPAKAAIQQPSAAPTDEPSPTPKRRKMSAASRKRMSVAQKARWAKPKKSAKA